MVSPPLFKPRPNLGTDPGYSHEAGAGAGADNHVNHEATANQEDEWKNIKVVSWSLIGRLNYFLF